LDASVYIHAGFGFYPLAISIQQVGASSSAAALKLCGVCSQGAQLLERRRNVDVVFRFARDSPLEEGGFELPVPLSRKGLPGVAEGRCRTDRRGGVIKRRYLS
jgi:hypothetical protein